jgi:fibronectin type 3 domain-containing protein
MIIKQLLFIPFVIVFIFSGCAMNFEKNAKPKIDPNLPKVNENIAQIVDITSIAFEWKPIKDQRVEGYVIYRSDAKNSSKLSELTKVESRYSTHYTDENLEPNTLYNYRFSTYDKNELESIATKTISVKTKPKIPAVSFIDAISNLPRLAKVIWRPHVNDKVIGYLVYRLDSSSGKFEELANIDGRLKAEYIDEKLKDGTSYSYKIVSKTIDKVNSQESKIVNAVTKPLPLPTENLKATLNEPKQITLTWSKSKNKDVISYNIYASNSQNSSFSKIDTVKDTTYIHKIQKDGVRKFYKVRAVDIDNLEADENQIVVTGQTLAKPLTPILISVTIEGNKAIVKWSKTDNRAKTFNVIKTEKRGWNDSKTGLIKNIKGTDFVDENIVAGVEYEYSVQSVDEHGIMSIPTSKSKVMLPKIEKKR